MQKATGTLVSFSETARRFPKIIVHLAVKVNSVPRHYGDPPLLPMIAPVLTSRTLLHLAPFWCTIRTTVPKRLGHNHSLHAACGHRPIRSLFSDPPALTYVAGKDVIWASASLPCELDWVSEAPRLAVCAYQHMEAPMLLMRKSLTRSLLRHNPEFTWRASSRRASWALQHTTQFLPRFSRVLRHSVYNLAAHYICHR